MNNHVQMTKDLFRIRYMQLCRNTDKTKQNKFQHKAVV